MKKILTIIALALLAANTFGQQSQKIREFEEFLIRHGFEFRNKALRGGAGKSFTHVMAFECDVRTPRFNDSVPEIERQQEKQDFDDYCTRQRQELEAPWDSIRILINSLAKDAAECYMREGHPADCDSITYLLRFEYEDGGVHKYEDIRLMYFQGLCFNNKIYSAGTNYMYSYTESNCPYDEEESRFDINAFERYLSQVMAPFLKWKGARQYSVRWEYDEDYPMRERNEDAYLYHYVQGPVHVRTLRGDVWVEEQQGGSPARGAIRGTDYFIPKARIDSTWGFLRHIETEVVKYLEQHEKQNYHHTSRHGFSEDPRGTQTWDFSPLHELLASDSYLGDTVPGYALYAITDDEGVHILSLTHPVNALWIPKGFQKMKSWKNGKAKYRR